MPTDATEAHVHELARPVHRPVAATAAVVWAAITTALRHAIAKVERREASGIEGKLYAIYND
jgi:hypothetical protein